MDCRDEMTDAQRTARIRALNDHLRTTGLGGKTMLTRAVAELPPPVLGALLTAVRSFDGFTADNDPWGEHDFGSVQVGDEAFFWKIDCYDTNLEFGSPDPTDETISRRVLTLMVAADL